MKKPILTITVLLTLFFILIWLADTVLPSFNPNYQPLLGFLKVIQFILEVILGL